MPFQFDTNVQIAIFMTLCLFASAGVFFTILALFKRPIEKLIKKIEE